LLIFFPLLSACLDLINLFSPQKKKKRRKKNLKKKRDVRCPESLEVCTIGIKMCLKQPPDTSWTGKWAVKK